jgi:hypothetical protein
MQISKLKPIKVDASALEKVEQATKEQSISSASPRTFDPNYPMFRFETNNRHLVYVPNFYEEVDGRKELLRETAFVHSINKGRQFMQLRSTQGLAGLEELGISGESPLYEAVQECWELYNLKYKQFARAMGIDPNDDKGDVLKNKRQELLSQRVIKDPDKHHYFPIVVFETTKDQSGLNTFQYVLDEKGIPKYQICWMDVSDAQWNEKWEKLRDSFEDEKDCVAGKLLVLNYHFSKDINKEKNPRRDSGKALQISVRVPSEQEKELFKYLDEQAKDWTPAKAREVIVACALLSDEQQREIVDELMQETRMELDQLKKLELGLGAGSSQPQLQAPPTPEAALASFGGIKQESQDQPLKFGSN